jgi:branched-chain amino acid transport system permease protein
MKLSRNTLYALGAIVVALVLVFFARPFLGQFWFGIFTLAGIFVVLALGLNLINGFTGLFSLGHAGFMAVGAYTVAICTLPPDAKKQNFFLLPMNPLLAGIQTPFWVALILGTLMAALAAWLIAIPALRLRDDYLAIATLGFGEIIRVVFSNTQSITNGAQGLIRIPTETSVWWSWGIALLMIVFMVRLVSSSFGRSLKAIRDDEVAAEAMGINLYRTKITSFVIGSAMAGLGGGLLAGYLGSIDPKMFNFLYTFNIVLIIVLGGLGSISGSVIAAVVITFGMEWLRFLDGSVEAFGYRISGVPGLRMVVFSALLLAVVLFWREGLMGKNELTPEYVKRRFGRKPKAAVAAASASTTTDKGDADA